MSGSCLCDRDMTDDSHTLEFDTNSKVGSHARPFPASLHENVGCNTDEQMKRVTGRGCVQVAPSSNSLPL